MQTNTDDKNFCDQWFRQGRGHGFPFYATHDEISHFFLDFFSTWSENVYICGTDLVKNEQSIYYEQVSFCYAIERIIECICKHQALNFHIGLEKITPSIDLITSNDHRQMSLSGLIHLQIPDKPWTAGKTKEKRWNPCSIGIVNKIINFSTNEMIEHVEYYKIFQQIKRKFKKILQYKTVFHGTSTVDTQCRMSKGIFERWQSGEIFEHDAHVCDCPSLHNNYQKKKMPAKMVPVKQVVKRK